MRYLIAFLGLLTIGGCSTQQYAGLTSLEVTMKPKCDGPTLAECAATIKYIDGKEKANVATDVDLTKGHFAYTASDVKAFDGQALRAAVDKALIETAGQTIPQVADAIVRAVITSMVPIPPLGVLP